MDSLYPNLNQFVKKKVLSFSFSFGMDFSVSECVDLFLSKKSLDFLTSLSYNNDHKETGMVLVLLSIGDLIWYNLHQRCKLLMSSK